MARPRRPLSKPEREARRAAEREQVRQAVAALQSTDGWKAWLRVRRHFRQYWPINQLLIAQQCPHATHVAGFRAWLNLGYAVRRGEKAVRIFAPCPPSKKQLEAWQQAGADPHEKPRTYFRLVAVFDRSQVDELPPPATPAPLDGPPMMVALEGDGLAWAYPLLVRFAQQELAVPIELKELPAGGPDGYYTVRGGRLIAIAARLSVNARVSTLVHELAHALVRHERQHDDLALDYASEELLAETVSHIACGSLGLDVSASSIPYLASWAQQASIDTLERIAGTIDRIARRIEDAVLDDEGRPRAATHAEEARIAA